MSVNDIVIFVFNHLSKDRDYFLRSLSDWSSFSFFFFLKRTNVDVAGDLNSVKCFKQLLVKNPNVDASPGFVRVYGLVKEPGDLD